MPLAVGGEDFVLHPLDVELDQIKRPALGAQLL